MDYTVKAILSFPPRIYSLFQNVLFQIKHKLKNADGSHIYKNKKIKHSLTG